MANKTTYNAGVVTAYGAAVRGGYTGTYDEWCAIMADYPVVASRAEAAATSASESAVAANAAKEQAQNSASDAHNSELESKSSADNAAASEEAAKHSETMADEHAERAESAAQSAAETFDNFQEVSDQAVQDVTEEGTKQIGRLETKTTEILQTISGAETDAVESVTNAKASGLSEINTAKANAVSAVGEAQTTGVQAVNSAKDTAVEAVQNEGETQVQAVADKGAEQIEAVEAVLGNLEQDVTSLKSAMDDCFIFSATVYAQITNDSASVTEYKENGNRGYIGSNGVFSENTGYATFLYDVTTDGTVWFDTTAGNKTISVFSEHQIGTNSFIARYRTNDNNLPDAEHKLAVTTGQMLAIGVSVNKNTNVYNEFILNVPKIDDTISLKNDVHFNTAQRDDITSIAETVKKSTGTIIFSGADFVITNRNARYTVRRFDRSDIRAYLWRIYKCEIANGSQWVTLWEGSDADGVIKISGEDDFIGGYHGDETETAFAVYIDGVPMTGESVDMSYQTIEFCQESDVYHCNASQTPDVVAFKRNKILRFDADGCHVCNFLTAQENLDLQYIYLGMLSINRYVSGTSGTYLLTGYYTDGNYKHMDADTGLDPDHDVTKVVMSTLYGDAEIDAHYITDNTSFSTSVADYDTETSQRLKVYSGLRDLQMTAGQSIRAEVTIII